MGRNCPNFSNEWFQDGVWYGLTEAVKEITDDETKNLQSVWWYARQVIVLPVDLRGWVRPIR